MTPLNIQEQFFKNAGSYMSYHLS